LLLLHLGPEENLGLSDSLQEFDQIHGAVVLLHSILIELLSLVLRDIVFVSGHGLSLFFTKSLEAETVAVLKHPLIE